MNAWIRNDNKKISFFTIIDKEYYRFDMTLKKSLENIGVMANDFLNALRNSNDSEESR